MTTNISRGSTVIFQSYRTERVEPVVSLAMATVQQWAAQNGFAYAFLDDAFFDIVPQDFRERTGGAIWQMADLARLLHIKDLLKTFRRAIWIDADLVILDAAAFQLPIAQSVFFCREYWVADATERNSPKLVFNMQVNTSVFGFARGEPFLDWYTQETLRVTMTAPMTINWNKTPVSTRILSKVHQSARFPLYEHCAILSPRLHEAMQSFDHAKSVWDSYARTATGIAAINMTLSLTRNGLASKDSLLETLGVLWTLNARRPGWEHKHGATPAEH